jgi:hypothetical protein
VFVRKPFDLADAAYYSWKYLRIGGDFDTGLAAADEVTGRAPPEPGDLTSFRRP